MTRHKLTLEDRRKGGKSTAAKQPPEGFKSYNEYLGHLGLQRLADKYFAGNKRKAGAALSRIGNFVTDPFPANSAWSNARIYELPPELFAKVFGHCDPFNPDEPF